MNESPARKRGLWVRGAVVVAAAACAGILLIPAHEPGNPSDVSSAGRPAANATDPSATQTGTPSGTDAQAGDAQQARGAVSNTLSWQDQARLDAYRATTAAEALRHARRLDVDDVGRREIIGFVAGICRRVELSSRESYFESRIRHRSAPDTQRQRELHAAWWSAQARYCDGVLGTQVLAEAGSSPMAERARVEALMNAQGEIDLADLLTLDDAALLSAIVHSSAEDQLAGIADPELASRVWATFLDAPNPYLARQAGSLLAQLGVGAFADTQKLLAKEWWDPRSYDSNEESGLSRGPGQRETLVRGAAEQIFVCRRLAACGPRTALGLWEPAVSELHHSTGTEGYWRSMLSPLEWDAVETMLRRLDAERQTVRTR